MGCDFAERFEWADVVFVASLQAYMAEVGGVRDDSCKDIF